MAAQTCIEILDRLDRGRISPERAVRLLEKAAEQQKAKANCLHRRIISCITVKVKPADHFGFCFKVPVSLANFCLSIAAANPKLRRKLKEQHISLREIRSFIRFLKFRETGFDIRVEAKDGSKVLVHN